MIEFERPNIECIKIDDENNYSKFVCEPLERGYGVSRAEARQMVNHGQFEVNGKKVNIPSYLVKAGDVITVREIKKDNSTIKANAEANSVRPVPAWLEKDNEKLSGKVIRLAAREDIDIPIEEHLIVELYSK